MRLKIVLDSHIPFAQDIFSKMGEVNAVAGHQIVPETVKKANILIVRSVTKVDKALLHGSVISFVGSATAGIDHIDTEYLSECGVEFASAPGANAESVVEYVLSSMSLLGAKYNVDFRSRTLGIIGCGHVGALLATRCAALGMKVIQNDPPREAVEGSTGFHNLESLLRQSDIVSIHTPLCTSGKHPTAGLIGSKQLSYLNTGAWIINTARGGICNEQDMVDARNEGHLGALVLDVWENEPTPALSSIDSADIATGHIAGYSSDAKRNGVHMIAKGIRQHFGLKELQKGTIPAESNVISLPNVSPSQPAFMHELISQMMDIASDDHSFRSVMKVESLRAESFHRYRATYPERWSFGRYASEADNEHSDLLTALGIGNRKR